METEIDKRYALLLTESMMLRKEATIDEYTKDRTVGEHKKSGFRDGYAFAIWEFDRAIKDPNPLIYIDPKLLDREKQEVKSRMLFEKRMIQERLVQIDDWLNSVDVPPTPATASASQGVVEGTTWEGMNQKENDN